MLRQTIEIDGKRFVLVPEAEWRKVKSRARQRFKVGDLPPLPEADEQGNCPALEFMRVSISRDIVRERKALGLTQQQLAKMAGIRPESLSRLESGLHSPTVRTVEKIDRALKRAASSKKKSK